ncbi:MAG: ATP-dependent Clp protease adaptor ClpS [Planctomycetota bacterium]
MPDPNTAVAEPIVAPKQKRRQQTAKKRKRQPPYHVILWDDADHTYEYVMLMMKRLFRMPIERGYKVAKEVDSAGRAICMTTTMELAELKRDQIHAFGRDELLARCKGSMSATIEPAEG